MKIAPYYALWISLEPSWKAFEQNRAEGEIPPARLRRHDSSSRLLPTDRSGKLGRRTACDVFRADGDYNCGSVGGWKGLLNDIRGEGSAGIRVNDHPGIVTQLVICASDMQHVVGVDPELDATVCPAVNVPFLARWYGRLFVASTFDGPHIVVIGKRTL